MLAETLHTQSTRGTAGQVPIWFWLAAGFGLLWNAYGVFQFAHALLATRESLVAMGMSEMQADTLSTYPMWMTLAFATGTLGGLAGSALLLLRRRLALPVFAVSLAGYVALYIGDITEGVFAALGPAQVVILSLVVAIACLLLWVSARASKAGMIS